MDIATITHGLSKYLDYFSRNSSYSKMGFVLVNLTELSSLIIHTKQV